MKALGLFTLHQSKYGLVFFHATILADLFIYMPAICALIYQRRTIHGGFPYIVKICQEIAVALLSPAQILIDHGHFQSVKKVSSFQVFLCPVY